MLFKTTLRTCLAIVAFAALSACDSAEERAEKHFQSAVELLESGDYDRAVVEFRNVFKLDPTHRGARSELASALTERGKTKQAARHYRVLAEAYPDDLDSRVALALYSIELSDWENARTFGDQAQELDANHPKVQIAQTALDYYDAVNDLDAQTRRVSAEKAVVLRSDVPDNIILANIIIDNALREEDTETALRELDSALEKQPGNRNFHMMRLAILNETGDLAALEKHLLAMIEQFPDDASTKSLLVQFYISQDNLDQAESFLRGLFDPTDEDPANYVAFIQFLQQQRGTEATFAELDNAIAVSPTPHVFKAMKAGLEFEEGRREQAIAALETLIAETEESKYLNTFRVTLARMLAQTGNEVGARRYVEEVLKDDPESVEALKMSAVWMIRDDKAEDAIIALRSALEISPEDTQIMALIADAHTRNGNRELARDMLALAAESSNYAPAETLRYANVLLDQDQTRASEEVLIRALRLAPNDVGLLTALGRVYVKEADWPRASQVENTLRNMDTPQATEVADSLKLSILQNQQKSGEAVEFLESLIEENGQNLGATVAILQTHLRSGDTDKALAVVDQALSADPENSSLLFLKSATLAANGQLDKAIEGYKSLLETNPENERLWLEAIKALHSAGRDEEARQMLEDALEQLPEAPNLLWAKASQLEQAGEIDATIEIYERLYAASSESPIVANNLASLLATYKDDEESLTRAYAIARRLRGVEVPAFQDTYGWIAYRRGLLDEAVQHLEPGAAGLPNDPLAQFHLGMTYAALERPDEAIEALKRALELAPADDERPQFAEARKKLEELEGAK